MKKFYSFLFVLVLCAMPLIISGCFKETSTMNFKTTYVNWEDNDETLYCTYGMNIDNKSIAHYINVENFTVWVFEENSGRGEGVHVEYISEETSLNKNNFIYINPQSDNNLLKIGFSVRKSFYRGEIRIMCFDKDIYTGKIGFNN